jgi:hypothetical protein
MTPPIARSADHRYTFEGKTYPGVTGILSVLDKSGPLMSWAANQTAEAAIAQVDNLPSLLATSGPEGVRKLLTARSSWQRDEAAALGTEVHRLADMVVNSKPTPSMTDTVRKRVLAYVDWWTSSGWTLRLSEAMVILPDEACGFGGTFDLLARDRDGRTILADIKTGKAIYSEAVLQMAAYGMAARVQPADQEKTYPMPKPDRYVILHVTADGVREVEVAVGTPERMAFLACRELHDWRESMKGKRL